MKIKTIAVLCGMLGFAGFGIMASAGDMPDAPFEVGGTVADSFENEISERIQLAQRSLPKAKSEFVKGMGQGRVLFLTIRLMDGAGKVEQVFVQTDSWRGVQLSGRVASKVKNVSGYEKGQQVEFNEGDILDWTIQNPDGSSEGNFVGSYVEQWIAAKKA